MSPRSKPPQLREQIEEALQKWAERNSLVAIVERLSRIEIAIEAHNNRLDDLEHTNLERTRGSESDRRRLDKLEEVSQDLKVLHKDLHTGFTNLTAAIAALSALTRPADERAHP